MHRTEMKDFFMIMKRLANIRMMLIAVNMLACFLLVKTVRQILL